MTQESDVADQTEVNTPPLSKETIRRLREAARDRLGKENKLFTEVTRLVAKENVGPISVEKSQLCQGEDGTLRYRPNDIIQMRINPEQGQPQFSIRNATLAAEPERRSLAGEVITGGLPEAQNYLDNLPPPRSIEAEHDALEWGQLAGNGGSMYYFRDEETRRIVGYAFVDNDGYITRTDVNPAYESRGVFSRIVERLKNDYDYLRIVASARSYTGVNQREAQGRLENIYYHLGFHGDPRVWLRDRISLDSREGAPWNELDIDSATNVGVAQFVLDNRNVARVFLRVLSSNPENLSEPVREKLKNWVDADDARIQAQKARHEAVPTTAR